MTPRVILYNGARALLGVSEISVINSLLLTILTSLVCNCIALTVTFRLANFSLYQQQLSQLYCSQYNSLAVLKDYLLDQFSLASSRFRSRINLTILPIQLIAFILFGYSLGYYSLYRPMIGYYNTRNYKLYNSKKKLDQGTYCRKVVYDIAWEYRIQLVLVQGVCILTRSRTRVHIIVYPGRLLGLL